MNFLYNILYLFFIVLYFPVMFVKGKWHKDLTLRMGIFSPELKARLNSEKVIWVHAVSVGEVLAVMNLISQIKRQSPEAKIILSTVTKTGYQLACGKVHEADEVIYAPLDLSWVVRKYIEVLDPLVYIAAETEIWPNLFRALRLRGIPIVQVNGRISDRSFHRYRMLSSLTRSVLRDVTLFCVQSEADAQRIIALGADDSKVLVIGNLKFDGLTEDVSHLPEQFALPAGKRIWVAGSTHPGEEEILVKIYLQLLKDFPDLVLVLVPRHVERKDEIVRLLREKGLAALKFSDIKSGQVLNAKEVLVVDKIGCLRALYKYSDLVFIGKSLVGQGGQNMIEPAFFGKPILTGPHVQNFRDIMLMFLREQAIIQVRDQDELLLKARSLLEDPQYRSSLGDKARKVVSQQQGTTDRTIKALASFLP